MEKEKTHSYSRCYPTLKNHSMLGWMRMAPVSRDACWRWDASTCTPSQSLAVPLFSLALLNRINTLEVISLSPQALLSLHHLPAAESPEYFSCTSNTRTVSLCCAGYKSVWFPARCDLQSHNVKQSRNQGGEEGYSPLNTDPTCLNN